MTTPHPIPPHAALLIRANGGAIRPEALATRLGVSVRTARTYIQRWQRLPRAKRVAQPLSALWRCAQCRRQDVARVGRSHVCAACLEAMHQRNERWCVACKRPVPAANWPNNHKHPNCNAHRNRSNRDSTALADVLAVLVVGEYQTTATIAARARYSEGYTRTLMRTLLDSGRAIGRTDWRKGWWIEGVGNE